MKRHLVSLFSGLSVTVLIGSVAGSDREVPFIINIQFMADTVISLSHLSYQIQITVPCYSSGRAEMFPHSVSMLLFVIVSLKVPT
jgi:hypothetical protein